MSQSRVLANLQLGRALAATMVVIGHTLQEYDHLAGPAGLPLTPRVVAWGCGVDIFFVISGFIMVHVSAPDFGAPGGPRGFIVKRLLRIVPLYWLITTALILGSFVAPQLLNSPIGGAWHIFASYFFIPDPRPAAAIMRPVMALGWTLNYEMLFYVVFALCMFLPLKRGVAALAAFFGIGALLRATFAIKQPQLAFWFDSIVLEFVFGVFVGLAWRAGWRLNGPVAGVLALAGFLAVASSPGDPEGTPGAWDFLRYGIPAALFVGAATMGPQLADTTLVRWGVLLGDASYALYLVHPFVIRPLREVWRLAPVEWLSQIPYCLVCVPIAIAVALALHLLVEKPLGKWLTGLTRRPSAATRPARAEA